MKPHPRIRRTIKWGGAVLTIMLAAVWVLGSMRPCTWDHKLGLLVWSESGHIAIGLGNAGEWTEWRGHFRTGAQLEDMRRTLNWQLREHMWSLDLPVWLPLTVALMASAAAWWLDLLAARHIGAGLCRNCRYDRTGLPAGAVCPECGAAPAGK